MRASVEAGIYALHVRRRVASLQGTGSRKLYPDSWKTLL